MTIETTKTGLNEFGFPKKISIFAVLSVLFYAILQPVLNTTSGAATEFYAFGYNTDNCCMAHPESRHMIGMGRYLGSLFHNLIFYHVHSLDDFKNPRYFGVFLRQFYT